MTAPLPQLDFDAAAHRYYLGGAPVVNVTRILEGAGLINYSFLGERREVYLARGRAVHDATACDDEGRLAEDAVPLSIRGYVESWRRFKCHYRFVPTLIEHRIFNPHYGYAGTLDRTGYVRDGSEWILDLKSGVAPDAVCTQLAAYAACLPHPRARRRRCVELHEDGSYRVIPFETGDYVRDFRRFVMALELFRTGSNQ
jgi:hypothetical protein